MVSQTLQHQRHGLGSKVMHVCRDENRAGGSHIVESTCSSARSTALTDDVCSQDRGAGINTSGCLQCQGEDKKVAQ